MCAGSRCFFHGTARGKFRIQVGIQVGSHIPLRDRQKVKSIDDPDKSANQT